MKRYIKLFLGVVFAGLLINSCQEDLIDSNNYETKLDLSKAPIVTTNNPVKVSAAYANLAGTETGATVDRGFLLSKSNSFTTGVMVIPADLEGDFIVKAGSLSPATTYYHRAYATNLEGGTTLGEIKSFTTREGYTGFSISYLDATEDDWVGIGFDDIDKDGDGETWGLSFFDSEAGLICMKSASWAGSPLTPENYLLFPVMAFTGIDGIFTINMVATNPNYPAEKFKVVVSDEPITIDNCQEAEVIFTHTLANKNILKQAIDVPATYEGGDVYFAIAHFDCSDNDKLAFLGATFDFAK